MGRKRNALEGAILTALYREFPLRSGAVWPAVVSFVKANAQVFAERGEPLRVIVTADEKKRNSQQNRMYWGAILKQISEQSWVNGRQFDKDVWHEHLARKFGINEEMTLPDGEIIIKRKSTTDMSVGEFSDYMNQIQAYATSELGVEFE